MAAPEGRSRGVWVGVWSQLELRGHRLLCVSPEQTRFKVQGGKWNVKGAFENPKTARPKGMMAYLLTDCDCGREICVGGRPCPSRMKSRGRPPASSPLLGHMAVVNSIGTLFNWMYLIATFKPVVPWEQRGVVVRGIAPSRWPMGWLTLQPHLPPPVPNARSALHVLSTSILKMLSTAVFPFPWGSWNALQCSSHWKTEAWCYSLSPFMRWIALGTHWKLSRTSTQQPPFIFHVFL